MSTENRDQERQKRALATRRQDRMYAANPTWWTRYARVFIPWQMVRFAIINLKMIGVIFRSH